MEELEKKQGQDVNSQEVTEPVTDKRARRTTKY